MELEPECTCICHVDGQDVMHFMPCCGITYEKFIRSDGYVDFTRYRMLLGTHGLLPKVPYINGKEFVVADKRKYMGK